MSRKTEFARSVRIAPIQSMPSRGCRFANNAITELFLGEIESRTAKTGFHQALKRLHSISGLKKVLHIRDSRPHVLELSVMYLGSNSLRSVEKIWNRNRGVPDRLLSFLSRNLFWKWKEKRPPPQKWHVEYSSKGD
jgi:hypothetical protein